MTRIDDLWNIFEVEYQQHIQDADSCIFQVVSMQPFDSQDILRKIFRSFHSLKGLARAMDLAGLEEVTHKCEDYLNYLTEHVDLFDLETAHELGTILVEIQEICHEISQNKQNVAPKSTFLEQVNHLLNKKNSVDTSEKDLIQGETVGPVDASIPPQSKQLVNDITETDIGVVQFFIELTNDLLKALLPPYTQLEQAQNLLINASKEIKIYSLVPVIESIQSDGLTFAKDLITELLSVKTKDNKDFIDGDSIAFFLNNILIPLLKLIHQKNDMETPIILLKVLDQYLPIKVVDPEQRTMIEKKLKVSLPYDLKTVLENLEDVIAMLNNSKQKDLKVFPQTGVPTNASVKTGDSIATIKPTASAPVPSDIEKSIRVSGSTLEKFMDNIGEIVLNNTRLNHFLTDKNYKDLLNQIQFLMKGKKNFGDELLEKVRSLVDQIDSKNESLNDSIHSLNSSLSTLHDTALDLRVVPMELIYRRLPRTVKLLANDLKKEVSLYLEGQDVQIDKIMVDTLSDPIIHILRNALDHGIESPEEREQQGKNRVGKITVKTEQQGSRIQLQIIDDGRGISREKIMNKIIEKGLLSATEAATLSDEKILSYIFNAGFSTAAAVSNISGRGVGMDIVRMNVMQLGGTISIASEIGKGTTFTIKGPITAAIQDVLIVSTNNQKIAIPNSYVNEVLQISHDDIMTLKNNPACILRDQYLPIINLGYSLGYSESKITSDASHVIVVISRMDAMIGIEVERIIEKTQVYMKEVDSSITSIFGIGGATIRGNGEVMIILDCEDIFDSVR
jgi:chemotaxis protein histidine kinase CheA